MFIARSAARVRLARLAFIACCLLPTGLLVGAAVHLRSDAHRVAVERRWREAIGLPLELGSVEHPRPGVVRVRGCRLPAAAGRPALELPLVELESSADEDRIRVPGLACDPGTALVLADLAGRWLTDEVRFGRTCIVEVADFSWGLRQPPAEAGPVRRSASLRVECVAMDGARAVRLVHRGQETDEVRVVRHAAEGPGVARIEVVADCPGTLPLAVILAVGGAGREAAAACGEASVSGTLEAAREASGWQGTGRGRIDGLDLVTASAALGGRGAGEAAVDIVRLSWQRDRITDALIECSAGPGWIDGDLFDRVVLALGARPGAARGRQDRQQVDFDLAACTVAAGARGVQVSPSARLPGRLADHRGVPLLESPLLPVPGERFAWLLAPPGTAFGPAGGPGAWLMSVLPEVATPATAGPGRSF